MIWLFDRIRELISALAEIRWLKDLMPPALIARTRELRMKVWQRGAYKELRQRTLGEGRQLLHFLHIGKTGGTAIMAALEGHRDTEDFHILITPHPFTLKMVPPGDKFAFVLRDPVQRFVSGFNNRKMQGKPSYDQPWTRREKRAFEVFETANELALALGSEDEGTRRQARRAMRDIEHVNTSYAFWLGDTEYLSSRMQDLLFVGFQENLDHDFAAFARQAGLSGDIRLPSSDSESNRTTRDADKRLEVRAIENLETWYAADFKTYHFCKRLRFDGVSRIGSKKRA